MVKLFGKELEDTRLTISATEEIIKTAKRNKLELVNVPEKEAQGYLERLRTTLRDRKFSTSDSNVAMLVHATIQTRMGAGEDDKSLTITTSGFPLADYMTSNLALMNKYFTELQKDVLSEISTIQKLGTVKTNHKKVDLTYANIKQFFSSNQTFRFKDEPKGFVEQHKFSSNKETFVFKYFDPLFFDVDKPTLYKQENNFSGSLHNFCWKYKGMMGALVDTLQVTAQDLEKGNYPILKACKMLDYALENAEKISNFQEKVQEGKINPEAITKHISEFNTVVNTINSYDGLGVDFIKKTFKNYTNYFKGD